MVSEWSNVNGWALARGIRLTNLHVSDLCDLVTFWLLENADEESARRVERELTTPPPDISEADLADNPLWSSEAEMASFGF